MQTLSGRAIRSVGWSCQVRPRSRVTATVRAPPRSSRQLIMIEPSASSTSWLSVVLSLTPVPICQLAPRSFDQRSVEWGTLFASLNWPGNTSVPSRSVIPVPGPASTSRQAGSFTSRVMFRGCDQVWPSSSLVAITSWPVSAGVRPGPDPCQARLPWLQRAATNTRPVSRSAKMQGSPTPSKAKAGSRPMSSATCIGSQVLPPSVLRWVPTSMSAGRSAPPR